MIHLDQIGRQFFPQYRVLKREELDSTNRLARQLADQGEPEGILVVAERQTAGKGRRRKTWFSLPGKSLTFSMLFRPEHKLPEQGPQLSLMLGLSLAQVLESMGFTPRLRWPNDVLLQGKKVAGILIESSVQAGRLRWVVAGIGINLGLERDDFPSELRLTATSLLIEGKKPVSSEVFLSEFLPVLSSWYFSWKENRDQRRMLEEYEKRSAVLGKTVNFKLGGWTVRGRADTIDENGGLWVTTGEGKIRLSWGEVSMTVESPHPGEGSGWREAETGNRP